MGKTLPKQIVDFSVYNNSTLIGTGDEMSLPDIVFKTYTATTPGGEIDLPTLMTENMEQETPFDVLDKEAAGLVSVGDTTSLTIRGAVQYLDSDSQGLDYKQIKVEEKGITSKVAIGTLKKGDKMDSSITNNLTYIKVTLDGTVLIEIDKLNGVCKINGKDIKSKIASLL
ncbi:MAG: phage major tail tube protein [Candidatus Ornithomonoglobus sp.]